jgi:hypothetical protein
VTPDPRKLQSLVARAFKGKLSQGVLRRAPASTLDAHGDPVFGTPQMFAFEGIREQISVFLAAEAGIPLTDAHIQIIAGSISTVPTNDDKVHIRGEWFQLRKLIDVDASTVVYNFAAFSITEPTP